MEEFYFFYGKNVVEEEGDNPYIFRITQREMDIDTLTNGKPNKFKILTYSVHF